MIPVFNERQAVTVTATFTGEGDTFSPTTCEWKLINETAGTTISDWEAVTAGDSVTIDIPSTSLVINNRKNKKELFSVTVSGDRNTATEVPNVQRFYVVRMVAFD